MNLLLENLRISCFKADLLGNGLGTKEEPHKPSEWITPLFFFFFSLQVPVIIKAAAAAAKLPQSCPTLCDPIDGSPPGSPIPRILQARTLEWVAISLSNAGKWEVRVKSLSHVWLSDPKDCSLPGSSIHGIFQARALEWVPSPSLVIKAR